MSRPIRLLTIASCVVATVILRSEGSERLQQLAGSVTIYRDAFGVAHVHGPTDASAAFGFAYAQAEDNFWQVEDNFIRAIGRAAEVHGEDVLLDDWINRALEIPRLSMEEYEQVDPAVRALLNGFADGFNYYLARNPDTEPRLLDHFEPWYPLAFIRYLYYQRGFLFGTRLQRAEFHEAFQRSTGERRSELPSMPRHTGLRAEQGSNSWAITPAKSASGNALLFINPHLSFFGPSQVYEGHVMSEEGWNFSGYTRFGFPLPYVGFNEHLGWASTDNGADLQDAYTITFDDDSNPLKYRYGDGHRTVTEWTEELRVKTENGIERRIATFQKTHHGPLVAIRDGVPLAVRMAKFEEPGWLDQWYGMTKAQTLDQFRTAVSRLDMLFGNYLYADQAGNIFYVYNAAVPRRSEAFDWREPVDGSDPATEWQGYHTMDEIPQVLNPATGWLQNCNGTPFLSTSAGNPDPDDFPSYMVREGDNPRHRQARRILAAQGKFTFEEWARTAYSTHLIQGSADISELVAEWERLRRNAPSRADSTADAIVLLGNWDHVSTVESEAMSLYVTWVERRWELLRARRDTLWVNVLALEQAMARLEREWGTWRVPWGELNRLQRRHTSGNEPFSDELPSIPVAGAPGWAGAMFTFYTRSVQGQRRHYGVAGNTYVAVVEFGPEVKARSLHTFGASADPQSPHFFDQGPRYAVGDFKPAWLTLSDVKEHAARSYHPGESGKGN